MLPVRQCLSRQAVHQVDIEIIKSSVPSQVHCLLSLSDAVDSAQYGKFATIEALNTEAQPVDAQFSHTGKIRASYRSWICLHGDFCLTIDIAQMVNSR